jgi:hypothetical protein
MRVVVTVPARPPRSLPEGAEGTVSSRRAVCERNRRVELFRASDVPDGEPQSYGTDRTDRRGNWQVDAALFAGDYYVRVAPKLVTLASHTLGRKHGRCRGTTSAPRRL